MHQAVIVVGLKSNAPSNNSKWDLSLMHKVVTAVGLKSNAPSSNSSGT